MILNSFIIFQKIMISALYISNPIFKALNRITFFVLNTSSDNTYA
jgi:hypothetical protein